MHDTVAEEWRHLNFFEREAYVHAKVPRVRCDRHGVPQVGVPWMAAAFTGISRRNGTDFSGVVSPAPK